VNRDAFTLLETLAAVTLLAMLAAAVVPLTIHLGHGERGLTERWQARQALTVLALKSHAADSDQGVVPVSGHQGWWLSSALLAPGYQPIATETSTSILAHRWRRLAIYADADAARAPLAEILVVEIPPSSSAHGRATP
jgi:prepilin-type N-terminal cleavage/methylation domain-containing protein